MILWNLTGTENQQKIVRNAFSRIKFPFERLTLPGKPECGWRDLNSGMYGKVYDPEMARQHGDNTHDGDTPDAVEGELEGRRFIMGVIYPMSGRIYLDVRLEQYPEMAHATLGAEIAHAVDFFLPMTDDMRNELLRLWNVPDTTWWERFDYGTEYFRLGGEAFMHEFVAAYSDINFGNKSSFAHDIGVEAEDVRRVLGIQRTDYVEPLPKKGSRWRKGTNDQDDSGGKGGSISQAEADRRANIKKENTTMARSKSREGIEAPAENPDENRDENRAVEADVRPDEGTRARVLDEGEVKSTPKEPMEVNKSGDVNQQLSEEGQENIIVGDVYKEDGTEREVIPYFVDLTGASVNFSDVGRSNEDRMRTSDFLNRFKHQGTSSMSGEIIPKEETESFKASQRLDEERQAKELGKGQ